MLEALAKTGLNLKLETCSFELEKEDFLGFLISGEGAEPGERKVRAIEQFEAPKNVFTVRRFLGLTSFFRRFIPNFSKLALTVYSCHRLPSACFFEYLENKVLTSSTMRANTISDYGFTICHRKEDQIKHVDALSRPALDEENTQYDKL